MDKTKRLDAIQKLIKLQEQMVLAEFSHLQRESDVLKQQLNHFTKIKYDSDKKLMHKHLYVQELATIKVFATNVERAINGIQQNLAVTDRNYAIVGERIKSLRTTLISINRLIEKYRIININEKVLAEQKQTEEFLSYTRNSQQ